MEEINFIDSVTERDIDILLLEELTVSTEFQNWLIGKTNNHLEKFIGVWRSITDSRLGESDLVVVLIDQNNLKHGLLIENKIDAIAQKDQAERYRLRGEAGIEDGFWKKFTTCIVSPNLYLESNSEAQKYQKKISYEDIENYFESKKDPRSAFKASMIREAIEQNRRGYTVIPDEQVTDLWNKYFKFVQAHYPEFEMTKPAIKPSQSDWVHFRPKILKKRMSIVHKFAKGAVDLQIAGMGNRLDELGEKLKDYIDDDVELVKTNKSGSLRITVPVVDRFGSFEKQKEKIEAGLNAARKLLRIGDEIKTKI